MVHRESLARHAHHDLSSLIAQGPLCRRKLQALHRRQQAAADTSSTDHYRSMEKETKGVWYARLCLYYRLAPLVQVQCHDFRLYLSLVLVMYLGWIASTNHGLSSQSSNSTDNKDSASLMLARARLGRQKNPTQVQIQMRHNVTTCQ